MTCTEKLCECVSKDRMWGTIQWLTQNTQYRLAGSEQQVKAAAYVADVMKEAGLEVVTERFYAYNSTPYSSELTLLEPRREKLDSLPCAHIRAAAPEGEELELVYVGDGSTAAYDGLDVRGKMVLVEVSYAPPVPEKARIACEMGAAGMICMNWGEGQDVICHRGLKGVWGNPTLDTFDKIPDIIGVGVTRNTGLMLKELCQKGRVVIKVKANSDRRWSELRQPVGVLRGNGESDETLLICSHLDAWQPGVTCNATGNATLLEIARILAQHRELLKRDIYFVFWNGHEIAEAAGSTWFVDNHWDELNRHCICYMHIDSTGVGQTEIFEIKASQELLGFAERNYTDATGVSDLRSMALKKIGDQSCMGIGIPSVTQRMSFTDEVISKNHGATLGWWNHTKEDGLDKCDLDILELDTRVTLSIIYKLATVNVLPYDIDATLAVFEEHMHKAAAQGEKHLRLDDVLANIADVRAGCGEIASVKSESMSAERADVYNRYAMAVCRSLSNVMLTCADKYQQDSYGYGKLSRPVPLLADLDKLDALAPDSLEYGLIHTQLIKNKNRINDALYQISELTRLAKLVLVK